MKRLYKYYSEKNQILFHYRAEGHQLLAFFGFGEVVEVFDEGLSQLLGAGSVRGLIGPAVLRIQDAVVHTVHMFRDGEVEGLHNLGLAANQFVVEDS